MVYLVNIQKVHALAYRNDVHLTKQVRKPEY